MAVISLNRLILTMIVLLTTTGCATVGMVNTISHVYSAEVQVDIAYGELYRQKFDLYLPETTTSGHPTPVIVYFFGGSWTRGNKNIYEFLGRRLASQGYIVAIPNYRVYPSVTYPDFLKDCAAAVKVVQTTLQRSEFDEFNPDQSLILMGHSAGAYNAAMLALDPQWLGAQGLSNNTTVKAWIGIAGPYDLYPLEVKEVQPVFHHPNYPPNSNPIDLVAGAQQPVLLLAAENDALVDPIRNSYAMEKALKPYQKNVTVMTIANTNHGTIIATLSPVLFFKDSILPPIKEFVSALY